MYVFEWIGTSSRSNSLQSSSPSVSIQPKLFDNKWWMNVGHIRNGKCAQDVRSNAKRSHTVRIIFLFKLFLQMLWINATANPFKFCSKLARTWSEYAYKFRDHISIGVESRATEPKKCIHCINWITVGACLAHSRSKWLYFHFEFIIVSI